MPCSLKLEFNVGLCEGCKEELFVIQMAPDGWPELARLASSWFWGHEVTVNARQRILIAHEYACSVCRQRILHAFDSCGQVDGKGYDHRSCRGVEPMSRVEGYFLPEGVTPENTPLVERTEEARPYQRSKRNYLGIDRNEYAELQRWKAEQARERETKVAEGSQAERPDQAFSGEQTESEGQTRV